MNWDAIGAAGEILGSLLVLVTLVYVAIQTRSINKQAEAETRYAFVEAMSDINLCIAQNSKNASVWRRGLASIEVLSDDEKMQFFMFIGQYTNLWSVMHQLHLENMLPATQWLIVRNDIRAIMGSPGGKYFWRNGGESAFDDSFSSFVNVELEQESQPYDMAGMTHKNTRDS